MEENEVEDMLNMVYPVGEERWVKVKYLDRDKAMKSFRFRSNPKPHKEDEENGYVVTAIGMRDEYTPQIQAILDLKGDIAMFLLHSLNPEDPNRESILDNVNSLFKEKLETIKEQTIKYD